jgi:hypothetical protein
MLKLLRCPFLFFAVSLTVLSTCVPNNQELEKIVNKKKKTCCAILALALNAREALRMEKMDARVAKMTIDNAKQKADAMGCSKKLTWYCVVQSDNLINHY